jgi:hypothetical protein
MMQGLIRVGRRVDGINPKLPGYVNIVVTTKSSEFGDLSPFVLKNEKDKSLKIFGSFPRYMNL